MKQKLPILTREEVERSIRIDRGSLTLRIYHQCKKEGLMESDGRPSHQAILKLNEALDQFDSKHIIKTG